MTPSGNINCDLGYLQSGTGNAAFCETLSPPQSATLSSTGSVKTCGLACEGNAEEGTPTLAYGGQTGIGPFQCRSAQSGVTCTASGQGFEISSSGIAPVGTPSVDLAPGSYNGTVETVSADVSEMTYNITSSRCGAVASSGTWTVDLAGASFVSNSEPSSGQGESVTVTPAQWQQEEQNQHSWTVVVVSGQPLEVTDGPSC